jgi:hypothetical protein
MVHYRTLFEELLGAVKVENIVPEDKKVVTE